LERENGERPIIISGGSIDIDFNHDPDFWDVSGSVYKCTGCKINEYWLYDEGEATTESPVAYIATPGATHILIEATHRGISRDIKIDDVGNDVVLDFDSSVIYQKRPGSARRHFEKKADAQKVKINNNENACRQGNAASVDCGKHVKPANNSKRYTILVRVGKR